MPSRSLGSGKWFAITLGLLAALVLSLPLRADIHPVPLEKTADSSKCLECHNSDDNREFGGTGPNGPHTSTYPHVLERNYQIGQSAAPGGPVTNLYPNPDQSPQGPYALCAKCHSLAIVLTAASWTNHPNHVAQGGFSCSICHTAHGMGAISPSVTGERLINFDVNVVAQSGASPISYNRATNTCTLVCHGVAYDTTGARAAV